MTLPNALLGCGSSAGHFLPHRSQPEILRPAKAVADAGGEVRWGRQERFDTCGAMLDVEYEPIVDDPSERVLAVGITLRRAKMALPEPSRLALVEVSTGVGASGMRDRRRAGSAALQGPRLRYLAHQPGHAPQPLPHAEEA